MCGRTPGAWWVHCGKRELQLCFAVVRLNWGGGRSFPAGTGPLGCCAGGIGLKLKSARKGGQAAGETRVSQVRPEGAARLSLMVGGLVLPRQAAWSSFTSVSW